MLIPSGLLGVQVFGPLMSLDAQVAVVCDAAADLYGVMDVLQSPTEDPPVVPGSLPALPPLPAALGDTPVAACDAVSFVYPTASAPALRSVTLSIARGDNVALVGRNGSGVPAPLRVFALTVLSCVCERSPTRSLHTTLRVCVCVRAHLWLCDAPR